MARNPSNGFKKPMSWFRVYTDIYRNAKLRLLPESLQLRFLWLLALHREKDLSKMTKESIAFDLRLTIEETTQTLKALQEANLLLEDLNPKGWDERQFDSDSSTGRVNKYREKKRAQQKETLHETLHETSATVTETPPESESYSDTYSNTEKDKDVTSGKPDPVNPNLPILKLEGEVPRVTRIPYGQIIDRLNEKAETQFREAAQSTRKLIAARFKDGYSLDDFFRVIDRQVFAWKGSQEWEKYLRPSTLFNATKFESYLNGPPPNRETDGGGVEAAGRDSLAGWLSQENSNLVKVEGGPIV